MAVRRQSQSLEISVADTGIGLPVDRRRITEPYMTTRAKGTGLGLAIVKKIVEDHCGRIDFADAPGGGTNVTLTFDLEALNRMTNGGPRVAEDAPQQVEPDGT